MHDAYFHTKPLTRQMKPIVEQSEITEENKSRRIEENCMSDINSMAFYGDKSPTSARPSSELVKLNPNQNNSSPRT